MCSWPAPAWVELRVLCPPGSRLWLWLFPSGWPAARPQCPGTCELHSGCSLAGRVPLPLGAGGAAPAGREADSVPELLSWGWRGGCEESAPCGPVRPPVALYLPPPPAGHVGFPGEEGGVLLGAQLRLGAWPAHLCEPAGCLWQPCPGDTPLSPGPLLALTCPGTHALPSSCPEPSARIPLSPLSCGRPGCPPALPAPCSPALTALGLLVSLLAAASSADWKPRGARAGSVSFTSTSQQPVHSRCSVSAR